MAQPTDDEKELVFQLIAQTDDFAALLIGLDGRILWANGGAEESFGRPLPELVGLPLADTFTPEDRASGAVELEEQIALASGASTDDRWHLRGDGSRFWASGVLLPLRDENGTIRGYGKLLRNRTDVKEQLLSLSNKVKALEAANTRQSTFLATLAHEIRNPLAPLSTAAEVLKQLSPDDERVQRFSKIVMRQIDSISRLVDDLLDVGRISTGKIQLRLARMPLQTILESACEASSTFVANHRFRSIVPSRPIIVDVDADRMAQVFVNLIANAAKYTPVGGTILVNLTMEGEEAVVRVIDDGVGIAPDMLSQIFEMFTQAESAMNGDRGLGIGLAVARDLVTLHGGTIQAVSDGIGLGSVFAVRLPVAAASAKGEDSP